MSRPGEIVVAEGDAPAPKPGRTAVVAVTNSGRFPAYLTSQFEVVGASRALEFERDGLEGAHPLLPSGGSVAIPPGETVEVEVTWD